MENKNYVIHYSLEKYTDGNNLCFSIEFLNYEGKQTYWYNDNHEFGNEQESKESSVKLAEWYLEKPWRIEMINSGWGTPKYEEYKLEINNFLDTLYKQNNYGK